jgi:hypothetical protein
MHTVDKDSEQGQRVQRIINEVIDVLDEYAEIGYPAVDLVSGTMAALAIEISNLAGHDEMKVLDYADQVKAVIMDVNTDFLVNSITGEPAND